jgi:hypothetical protein
MSDVRKGSYNVINPKRSGVAPVERKGSVQVGEPVLGEDSAIDYSDDVS